MTNPSNTPSHNSSPNVYVSKHFGWSPWQKQDGTHSVLNVWHDYKVIQADSLFNDLGALIFALEIGVATDTSKLATQDV